MKKNILVSLLFIISAAFVIFGCGKDPSAEAVKLNKQLVTVMKTYISDMDKADNAGSVANAMNAYADGVEEILPELKDLYKRHPELQDTDKKPEEIKKIDEESEEIGRKMGAAFGKVMKYMDDEEVQKAQARIRKIMM